MTGESLTGDEVIQLGVLGTVPSSSTTSTGTISLNLGGQIIEQSVSTELVNYDAGYNRLNVGDVDRLRVCIEESNCVSFPRALLEASTASGTFTYNGDAVDVAIF